MEMLIVVDMQEDFVRGSLGTKEAEEIVDNVVRKIRNWPGEIVFTMDTHDQNYLDSQEGRNLPVEHCLRLSQGWQILPEVLKAASGRGLRIFEKNTFASTDLAEYVRQCQPDRVEMIGLCTDICVVSNALMLKGYMPELPISVDSSCCAGVTVEKHNAALQTMASCQIEIR